MLSRSAKACRSQGFGDVAGGIENLSGKHAASLNGARGVAVCPMARSYPKGGDPQMSRLTRARILLALRAVVLATPLVAAGCHAHGHVDDHNFDFDVKDHNHDHNRNRDHHHDQNHNHH